MPVVEPSGSPISPTAFAPQLSGLVLPPTGLYTYDGSVAIGANAARGTRVVVPRDGTLHDVSLLINASAGNIDVGIYSLAAEPRARLWHSGPVASPGVSWQIIGDPALAVTQGEILDFVFATDAAGLDVYAFFAKDVGISTMPSANFWPVPNGSTKVNWGIAASYPLPVSFADAGLNTAVNNVCAIMARVA